MDIPTPEEFDVLKEVENILASFESTSRVLSADQHSTMTVTLTALVNLNHWCDQKKEAVTAQSVKQLLVKMKDLLQAEFPSCGSKEKMIRQAHMLHPYYKGLLLQKFGEFENTKKEMIDEHQSTADFLPQQRTTVSENLSAGNYFMKNKTNEPEFEVLSSLPILI